MPPLRILFLTPYVPSLLRGRPYNLLRHLHAAGHRVTVVTAYASEAERADLPAVRDICDRLVAVRVPRLRSLWNCACALPRPAVPFQAVYTRSPALMAAVHGALRDAAQAGQPCDVLHVEHLRAALTGLSVSALPRVYDAVDCMTRLLDKTRRLSEHRPSRIGAWLDGARTRRFEAQVTRRFDRVLVTSTVERQALADLAADAEAAERITAVSNGVDLDYFRPGGAPRDPATLLFVGRMGYHANINAVVHMMRDILPLIWARRPEVRFVVVGPDPPSLLRRAARQGADRIRFEGYVPDVRPYVARATVAVAPFVYAVGLQNKILEAMAMATPVVTTAAGAGPLGARVDEHLLVAPDAPAFAQQVVCLLDDPSLCERIGRGGRQYVTAAHDWTVVTQQLGGVYEQSVAEFRRRRGLRAGSPG